MSLSLSVRNLKEQVKTLFNEPGFLKYFKSGSWMLVARVVSLGVSFFVTTIVARYLGPYNYGQLSYATSFVGIFSFVSTLGIDAVLYREIVKFKDKKNVYMGTALVLKLLAGLLASVLSVVVAYMTGTRDIALFLISIISVTFIFNSFNIILYEFQASIESKIPSIISIVVTLLLSILKVGVVFFDKGIIYFSLVLLFEGLLYSVLYVYFRIKKYGAMSDWKFERSVAMSLFKDSWPMMFSSAFALVYARIDQVFIRSLINVESVGLYDAAVRVSEVWYFIPNIILTAIFPAIVNAKITNEVVYYKRLKYLLFTMILLSTCIALPVALLSKQIIFIIFGPAFIASFSILQIYIWSLIGTSVNHVLSHFLITENYRGMIFVSTLIGMLSNVALNIVLIPHYGMAGAAWATLISYSLGPISLLFYKEFRRKFKLILS